MNPSSLLCIPQQGCSGLQRPNWQRSVKPSPPLGKVFGVAPCLVAPCRLARDVNFAQIQAGMAWWVRRYASVLALAFPVQADFTGKVVAIADGANITVLKDSEQVQVRLVEIDAPELEHGFGIRSRQAMSAVMFGREVRVVEHGKDQYGRTLGRIYRGNLDVNADQVRKRMAWVYRPYAKDASLYQIEAEAKAARRGLWLDPHAIPPREWRRAKRGATG